MPLSVIWFALREKLLSFMEGWKIWHLTASSDVAYCTYAEPFTSSSFNTCVRNWASNRLSSSSHTIMNEKVVLFLPLYKHLSHAHANGKLWCYLWMSMKLKWKVWHIFSSLLSMRFIFVVVQWMSFDLNLIKVVDI
jgi:hypothetical protein